MISGTEKVTIPFKVDDLGQIGEFDTNVYIVDYEKSEYKGRDFIDYLCCVSKMWDIENYQHIDTETKFEMFNELYNQPELVPIPKIARSLILILFQYKGIELQDEWLEDSFFTKDEIIQYINDNQDKVKDYIKFFDSLFVFMMIVGMLMVNKDTPDIDIKDIDEKYKDIKINDCTGLKPSICAILFDNLFFKYYEKDLGKEVEYYREFYTKPLYMGHMITNVLLNSSNYIFKNILEMYLTAKSFDESTCLSDKKQTD